MNDSMLLESSPTTLSRPTTTITITTTFRHLHQQQQLRAQGWTILLLRTGSTIDNGNDDRALPSSYPDLSHRRSTMSSECNAWRRYGIVVPIALLATCYSTCHHDEFVDVDAESMVTVSFVDAFRVTI